MIVFKVQPTHWFDPWGNREICDQIVERMELTKVPGEVVKHDDGYSVYDVDVWVDEFGTKWKDNPSGASYSHSPWFRPINDQDYVGGWRSRLTGLRRVDEQGRPVDREGNVIQ